MPSVLFWSTIKFCVLNFFLGLNIYPKCPSGWLFLAQAYKHLHDNNESVKSAEKG